MKKISAYIITLGMLLTMLPNTAMPAAAAVSSSLTAEDSTQKSAIQGYWKDFSGSMLAVHDDNTFILVDADGTYCKGTVKQEDDLYMLYADSQKIRTCRIITVDGSSMVEMTNQAGRSVVLRSCDYFDESVSVCGFWEGTDGKQMLTVYDEKSYVYTDAAGKQTKGLMETFWDKDGVFFEFYSEGGVILHGQQPANGGSVNKLSLKDSADKAISFVRQSDDSAAKAHTEDASSIADLVGLWYYQDGDTNKLLTITFDSTFDYEGKKGTVKKETIKNPDGSEVLCFHLYFADGKPWIGFIKPEKKNGFVSELHSDQDDKMNFKRDTGNAQAVLFPNLAGFYQVTELKDAKYSVKNLEGTWIAGQFEDSFTKCSDLSGSYTFQNESGTFTGTVKLEAYLNADDSVDYLYNLYNDKGELFKTFSANEKVTSKLYDTNEPEHPLERKASAENAISITDLAGKWETVSYTDAEGKTHTYDMTIAEDVYRYVGLHINAEGQDALLLGTEGHPGSTWLNGNTLTTDWVLLGTDQKSTVFTVSADGQSMTVETIVDGKKATAVLKKITGDFAIFKAHLNANLSQISGEWREAGAKNRTLSIDINGNYTLTNTDGTKSTGKAKIELGEHGSGEQPEILYALYNEKGTLELSFNSVSQLDIFGGHDEVHGIRFVNSKLVAEEADISYLIGKWNYEEQNTKNLSEYDAAGTITVANDWTYTYQPADGSAAKKGTILLSFDDQAGHLADEDRIPKFDFYDEKNAYWFACFCKQDDPHIYYTGNGGPSRLVRCKEQEQTANQYSYYDVTDAPVTGISIKALEGKWAYDDVDILIYDGSMYSGKFKADLVDGTQKEGTVKLQYRLDDEGKEVFRYVLYTADGKMFNAFEVTGTLPLDSLMTADETTPVKFVRVKEETKGDITGDGTISADDAQLALTAYTEILAGNKTGLTGEQKAAADIDGNGTISVEDAQLILNYYTEKYVAGKNITWDDLLQKA